VMRLVGGSGVTINPAEVIPSLQRRVVDGAFTAAVPALDWKINEVAAFKAFAAEIESRCEEPPVATELTVVGSYCMGS